MEAGGEHGRIAVTGAQRGSVGDLGSIRFGI